MSDTRKDPDQLERQVDDARANLSQTVDALGEQLSPGQLLDQVVNLTKKQGGEFAGNLGQQVKDNPLALLLTGVGVTWLIAGSGSSGLKPHLNFKSPDSTSSSGGSAKDGESVAQRMQAGMDASTEAAKDKANAAKEKAAAAKSQFERTLREQPLVMSGLGIALGAALGALIPPTAAEDKLLGAKSDQAIEKATGALTDRYEEERDRLKHKAQETGEAMKR